MGQRDTQYGIAVLAKEDITLTTTPGDFVGTGIELKGFSKSLTFGIELASALAGSDDVRYKFQFSPDGSAWTDAPAEAYLPTWKQAEDNTLENAVAPYTQTCGVMCNNVQVRIVLEVVVLASGQDVTITTILSADQTPFNGWTTTVIPTDGKP